METLEEQIRAMFGVFGAIMIIVAIFIAIILWLIIKSAVKEGVKQALEETTISASIDNVTNGIVIDTRNVTPQQHYYNGQQYNGNWTQF